MKPAQDRSFVRDGRPGNTSKAAPVTIRTSARLKIGACHDPQRRATKSVTMPVGSRSIMLPAAPATTNAAAVAARRLDLSVAYPMTITTAMARTLTHNPAPPGRIPKVVPALYLRRRDSEANSSTSPSARAARAQALVSRSVNSPVPATSAGHPHSIVSFASRIASGLPRSTEQQGSLGGNSLSTPPRGKYFHIVSRNSKC